MDQIEVLDGDKVPDIEAVADAELVLEPLCVPDVHAVGEDDTERVAEAVLQPEWDAVDDDVPDTDDEREGVTVCVLQVVADGVCDGDDLLDRVLFSDGFIAVRDGADDAEGRTDVESDVVTEADGDTESATTVAETVADGTGEPEPASKIVEDTVTD